MRALLATCLCVALLGASVAASAQLTQQEIETFTRKHLLPSMASYTPPEIRKIVAALKAREFGSAILLSTAVLEAPDNEGESPQFNLWIRSLAYLYRGHGIFERSGDWSRASPDIKQSAEIGNIEAVRFLIDAFMAARADKSALGGYQPTTEEVKRYFTIAANLISSDALVMLAEGEVAASLPADQRMYWRLLSLAGLSGQDQIRRLMRLVEAEGERKLASVLAQHALVGAPFARANPEIAGRDLFATLYAERHLRHVLASSLGARAPRERRGEEAPTIMEHFLFLSTLAGLTGFADMYLLVPGEPSSRDRNIRSLDREAILQQIQPGDSIWVSCGPLSHTATVFSISLENDELLLVDTAYEFWQASHHSCVTSLSHQPFKYGFYLPRLKVSEVAPIIDAVGTFRTAEFIGLAGDVSQSLVSGRASEKALDSSSPCKESGTRDTGLVGRRLSTVMGTDLALLSHR